MPLERYRSLIATGEIRREAVRLTRDEGTKPDMEQGSRLIEL